MNAVNILAREQSQAEFEATVAAANKSADVGRPIIMATIRLEGEVEDELRPLLADNARTYHEACGYVRDARKALEEMLDGIRSNFLANQMPPQPPLGATEQPMGSARPIRDALDAEVVSVRALIKQVEAEDYEAFLKGRR